MGFERLKTIKDVQIELAPFVLRYKQIQYDYILITNGYIDHFCKQVWRVIFILIKGILFLRLKVQGNVINDYLYRIQGRAHFFL